LTTFTGSGARPWSPVSGIGDIGTTGRRHIIRSTNICGREFGNTTTASKDRDRGASTIMMYNINVGGGLLVTTGAAIGLRLRIGIGRGGCRRHCVAIWSGALGQEWFDKVLVVTDTGSRHGGTVRSILGPLESALSVDIGGMINRVRARVAPDFVVSSAGK
jgi:hypothetical protein